MDRVQDSYVSITALYRTVFLEKKIKTRKKFPSGPVDWDSCLSSARSVLLEGKDYSFHLISLIFGFLGSLNL